MQTYIALLRGINIGGHKKIKIADLKLLFEALGFKEVVTYIQSGNIVFLNDGITNLEKIISEAILKRFKFEVPIIVKKITEVEEILAACPFDQEKKTLSYFTLLHEAPSKEKT